MEKVDEITTKEEEIEEIGSQQKEEQKPEDKETGENDQQPVEKLEVEDNKTAQESAPEELNISEKTSSKDKDIKEEGKPADIEEASTGKGDPEDKLPVQEDLKDIQSDEINSEFEHMLEESLGNIQEFEIGDQVEGEIINITDSYIFVSLGGKRDVYAEKVDYYDKEGNLPFEVGDKISGYVVKCTETEIMIARSLVSVNKSVLKDAFEEKIPVNGKVISTIKGGFNISVSGVRAFCPQSQIDTRMVKDIQQYIGQNFDFRIIDFSEKGRNIVLSRRVLLEEELEKQKQETLSKVETGDVVLGKVTRLTNFGAFVDLGGVEGLVHISEFSWSRIESPSDVLNIGDEIKVKIIAMEGEKISLSMKAIQMNPFQKVTEDIKEGDVLKCRVVRNLPFGSFVEVKPGVEGLIPVSELTLGKRINHPSEILNEGDLIEAQVTKIKPNEQKITLSLKALQPDPWDSIDQIIKEDGIVNGVIENVLNFGAFVTLGDGIVGLMPSSKIKLAGLKLDKSNIGEDFKVRVVSVDRQNKRISLEPTNLPESVSGGSDNWRKYRRDKKDSDINDSPFADL